MALIQNSKSSQYQYIWIHLCRIKMYLCKFYLRISPKICVRIGYHYMFVQRHNFEITKVSRPTMLYVVAFLHSWWVLVTYFIESIFVDRFRFVFYARCKNRKKLEYNLKEHIIHLQQDQTRIFEKRRLSIVRAKKTLCHFMWQVLDWLLEK